MPLLTDNNVTAELSYAYLHAVAAKAGMGCSWGTRHDDGAGVDATLRVQHDFGAGALLSDFTVDVQLKSTIQDPVVADDCLSFALPLKNYDELRSTSCSPLKLLVVLFLPADHARWLEVSEDQLISRRCAYWLGLHGAPTSENMTSQTVYIPKVNVLTPDQMLSVARAFARKELVEYVV